MVKKLRPKPIKAVPLKLDLGCGQSKREGFTGVDISKVPGVDVVHNLFTFPWPFKDDTVEEIWCSHFLEHVPNKLRFAFMDECYRILFAGGKAAFLFPYYSSMRAIQDPTHEWPPLCEFSFLYFNKQWREQNKLDHYPVKCDFDYSYNYAINPAFVGRSQEFLAGAIPTMLNIVTDQSVTMVKRPKVT